MGAPLTFALDQQAKVGIDNLENIIKVLQHFNFEQQKDDHLIRYEPIGVCGLITPWNWPIGQVVLKVAPALAAGCTMVLKPSEISPISAIIFTEILHDAGVPKGVFNLVNGFGHTVGEAMSAHCDIDMMSFTGSTRGGIAVAKASADTVKRVSQELGGKSANILLDDAAFGQAVKNGVDYVMSNSGQSCDAPSRMLVPNHRMTETIHIAKQRASELIVGDPNQLETELGPVVNETQFNNIQNLIKVGVDEGALLVAGGLGRPKNAQKGYYVKPTIFGQVTNKMRIAKEEIFGPVLVIIGYENEREAISIANDTIYGLAAYVSGIDQLKAIQVAKQLRAGQITINYTPASLDAPFGGYRQSGNGREQGEWGFHEYLEVKSISMVLNESISRRG